MLLRPKKPGKGPLRRFFDGFNRAFARATRRYVHACGGLIPKGTVAMIVLGLFAVGAAFFGEKLPPGFLPDEDQGYVFVNLQLPNAASLHSCGDGSGWKERPGNSCWLKRPLLSRL
ncbi:MAG: efflux RND transporter permease subunit [Terriglobia bacterium]